MDIVATRGGELICHRIDPEKSSRTVRIHYVDDYIYVFTHIYLYIHIYVHIVATQRRNADVESNRLRRTVTDCCVYFRGNVYPVILRVSSRGYEYATQCW